MRQSFGAFIAYIKRVSIAGALRAVLIGVLANIGNSSMSAEWNLIRDLLASPSSYSMHVVTIRGTLRSLRLLPDFPMRGCVSPGAYQLTIDDETGILEVLVCSQPMNARDSLNVGDNVELEVLIYPVKKESASIAIEAVAKQLKKLGGN